MPKNQPIEAPDTRPNRAERGTDARRKPWMLALIVLVLALGAGLYVWSDGEMDVHPPPAAPPMTRTTAAPAGTTIPEGMVYVPGGVTHIGSDEGSADEQPIFRASVEPFLMDEHPVTVAEFRAFVAATGYVTDAERFGDGGVLDVETGAWRLVAGANWRQPLGPTGPSVPDNHPATQISWNDAVAYTRWAGKRLPTEIEWEHAARGARDSRSRYAWGDELASRGMPHANTWEGSLPTDRTEADEYLYTSPVGTFGATDLGLTDMGGNVWEWTADWYRPYSARDEPYTPVADSERVQRGGSFLCRSDYCHGYRVSARSHSTPETSLFHVGFRAVRDIE